MDALRDKGILGFLTVVPVVALVRRSSLPWAVRRGPGLILPHGVAGGSIRSSGSVRYNSVIFALAVTTISLVAGVGLGWLSPGCDSGESPFFGPSRHCRWRIPVVLALGPGGDLGGASALAVADFARGDRRTRAPASRRGEAAPVVFLDLLTLPSAVAIVMVSISPAVERIDPAWEDASRLAGAGGFRTWRCLIWPLIRPAGGACGRPGLSPRPGRAGSNPDPGLPPDPRVSDRRGGPATGSVPARRRVGGDGRAHRPGRQDLVRRWGGPPILGRSELARAVAAISPAQGAGPADPGPRGPARPDRRVGPRLVTQS